MNQYQPLPPFNANLHTNPADWLADVRRARENWQSIFARLREKNNDGTGSAAMLLGLGRAESLTALLQLWHETEGCLQSTVSEDRARPPNSVRLSNVLVLEPNPPTLEGLVSLAQSLPNDEAASLRQLFPYWPTRAPGWHQMELFNGQLLISMHFGNLLTGLRGFAARVSAISGNSGLVDSAALVHAIATQSVQGAVWNTESLPSDLAKVAGYAGFATLSERTPQFLGYQAKRQIPAVPESEPHLHQLKRIAVIGAGIAGSSVALRLCQLGVQVTLFDAANQPASGASGNWVGAFHPHFSRDDAPLSQLTRLGCEHTLAALNRLTGAGFLTKGRDWDVPGHLQTVPDEELEKTRESLSKLQPDPGWVQWREQGETFAGSPAGLWFPAGGWVRPAEWVRANLNACGDLLDLKLGHHLQALPEGFDAVVVACAESSLKLASAPGLSANQVKGQVSLYQRKKPLPCILSGHSYAIDCKDDWLLLGATYERPVLDLQPTAEADRLNRERFEQSYPGWPVGELLDHRCSVRSVWPDRLPAVGSVPGLQNVLLCTGFASRGLTWAAMAAWQIGQLVVYGDAQPVTLNLLERLSPSRYYQPPKS